MKRKYPHPDGEENFQRALEIIRNTPIEEFDARIARYEREHEAGEAEYRRLMGISDPVPAEAADAPLSLTETQKPRVIRRPRRPHRVAA